MSAPTPRAASPRLAPLFPGWPVVGALPALQRDLLGTFERAARLGDVVRFQLFHRTGHLLVHPDAVKHVLVDEHRKYGKQTRGYDTLRLVLGQGLVTSEGELWRRQRRIAQPAFHHARLVNFGERMVRAGEQLLERWAAPAARGEALELDRAMMQVTLQIVGECLLSVDLSDESDVVGSAVGTMLRQSVRRITRPLRSPPLSLPTPGNRRFLRARAALDEVVYGIIRERRARPSEAVDLLAMFLEARDEETGEGMNDQQLRDEVITMVTAGHETTANALTWTFYLLGRNPEARSRLEAELDAVLAGRAPTVAELGALPYTEAVLKESMRLFPPVWMIGRSAQQPDEVGGYAIPAGSMMFLSPWITQHDARFFPEPARFRPERFLAPEAERIPRFAYFPFASGPRVCIGNGFAMMEARLLLALIAQRYRMQLVEGQAVVSEAAVTLRPRDGLRVMLERR
jgi:cytochrome P450